MFKTPYLYLSLYSWNTYQKSILPKVLALFTLDTTFKWHIKNESWKPLEIPNMPDCYTKLPLLKYEVSTTQKILTTERGSSDCTLKLVLLQSSTKVWKLIIEELVLTYPLLFS